jgi:hypothetical protein
VPDLRTMNAATRANLIEMIGRLAGQQCSDPDIGATLGLKAHQVARLRRAGNIAAGERRWLGASAHGAAQ